MESHRDRSVPPSLTAEMWRRLKTIASAALDLPESERERYVADACGADDALRFEVLSLLRATADAEHHFETPAGALAASRTPSLEIGSCVGPYRLVRPLGSGGMGSVYLAERADAEFEQRVAIKVVRGGFGTPFLFERFREERRILASLEHPHIARLIDGGTTDDGLPYVAMEYVEGELIDVFCRVHRLDLRRRLEILREVCAAVHFAHQRLVVHRDIKSANILVTADGTPKLLDFGIAKLTQPGLADDRSITTCRVVTPESASPEQLQGKPITIATDVYALGVLLFRLLTGQSPYGPQAASETELIHAVCERTPEPPSTVAARIRDPDYSVVGAVPSDVDAIVLKALRKEPERRYGSVEQFSEDIRRHLNGHPVLAAPDSVLYRGQKFVRRHRVAMLGAAGICVALCAGMTTTVWQARVAREERARAERQFAAVRTLGTSVLRELYDAVGQLGGSLPARELLVRRTTEYLDALARNAGDNMQLRREVADGYMRLGQLQGTSGGENLGDPAAAARSYANAAAVLEPLTARPADADPHDRLTLAAILLRLDAVEGSGAHSRRPRAQALIEGIKGDTRLDARTRLMEVELWHRMALQQVAAKDYRGARESYSNEVRAAEAHWRLAPADMNASRNLSLACKQLGAVQQVLDAPNEARSLYERALALDRARVDAEPKRGIWRLDLSFSVASIGSLLLDAGDLDGAFAQYREAAELRRTVVASEPQDQFARVSLARGYQRLAVIDGRRGRIADALGWHHQRVELYRAQVSAHPERDAAWREYAQAAFESTSASLDLLQGPQDAGLERRAHLARVQSMVRALVDVRTRWVAEGRPGQLPPSEEELRAAMVRLQRLGR